MRDSHAGDEVPRRVLPVAGDDGAPADGSAAARFRALFDAYAEPLERYALRIVRSRESAEDVVQEVFLRLWIVWDRVEVGEGTRSYLYITTRARALNHIRRVRGEERRTLRGGVEAIGRGVSCDVVVSPPQEDDVGVDMGEVARAIGHVIAGMPPRQREVASLRLLGRVPTAEVARRLGISPRTVELHVARATKALRARLPALLGVIGGSESSCR